MKSGPLRAVTNGTLRWAVARQRRLGGIAWKGYWHMRQSITAAMRHWHDALASKVLKKLGIFDDVQANLRPYPNGAVAMANMAQSTGDEAIGCTQLTEILYTQGVTLVGLLPKEFEL